MKNSEKAEPLRVRTVKVVKLFERFTHEIPLSLTDRVTIVIGPNGYGKTMILRMLYSLFSQSNLALSRIPFHELLVEFDNGATLSVSKKPAKSDERDLGLEIAHRSPEGRVQTYRPKNGVPPEEVHFPPGIIDDLLPELERIERWAWRHRGTGEILSFHEVLDKYADVLPVQQISGRSAKAPRWLRAIRTGIPVGFLTTDRLYAPVTPPEPSWVPPSRHRRTELAVRKYSEELGEIVKQTFTEYGTLSQSLDRTFPVRVVSEPPTSDITMESLRKDLADIEAKRQKLVQAGLLGPQQEPWQVTSLDAVDESKRGVLAVYARDAMQKLRVFDQVFQKVNLFRTIVNERFLHKELIVGPDGFQCITAEGKTLDVGLLSSGEQHQIVILYELLFRVHENSLILIDEPELSLHVAWQEAFLRDLAATAMVSQFDALVATHSPQIVSDHWDLTVELKDPKA